jgi:hypothetical protein
MWKAYWRKIPLSDTKIELLVKEIHHLDFDGINFFDLSKVKTGYLRNLKFLTRLNRGSLIVINRNCEVFFTGRGYTHLFFFGDTQCKFLTNKKDSIPILLTHGSWLRFSDHLCLTSNEN